MTVAVPDDGPAVLVEGLHKSFGKVRALCGVDLAITRGTVLGLLGPNGAGKTTLVRILATLLSLDAGRALVDGLDVVREPARVRRVIALAGQNAAVDEMLTGRENLELVARLWRMGRHQARARATELLERFELADAANRPVKTYSGGMRRRLDLGASLVGRPSVLLLDEPTTGLDPRSRFGMWDVIRDLVDEGTTLLLTTQYLEEADRLADEIAVVDHGAVIASGTAEQLKARIGGDVLGFVVPDRSRVGAAIEAVAALGSAKPTVDHDSGTVTVAVGSNGSTVVVEAVRRLDAAAVEVVDLSLRRPSLDDVFLSLTGRHAEGEPVAGTRQRGRGGRSRASQPAHDAEEASR